MSSQCTNQKLQQDLEEDGDDEWEMTGRKLQCEPRALRWYRQLSGVEEREKSWEHRGCRESQRAQHR